MAKAGRMKGELRMLQSPPPGISCWVRVANVELHLGNTLLCASSKLSVFLFPLFFIFSLSPFQPDGESLDELEARIIGSKGCPFAGGMFKLKITVLIPLPTNFSRQHRHDNKISLVRVSRHCHHAVPQSPSMSLTNAISYTALVHNN